MPTSYTAPVAESDDYPFEQFVWRVARAFGPLHHMRNDSFDAKIRLPEESFFDLESRNKKIEALNNLQKMTLAQVSVEIDKEFAKFQQEAIESIESINRKKVRYQTMLGKVIAWVPPSSEHVNLKKYMIEQLNECIAFDCNISFYEQILDAKKQTPEVWLKERIKDYQDDLESANKHLAEQKVNIVKATKWITDLADSVPTFDAMGGKFLGYRVCSS